MLRAEQGLVDFTGLLEELQPHLVEIELLEDHAQIVLECQRERQWRITLA